MLQQENKTNKLSYATLGLSFANIHGFTGPPAWVPCFSPKFCMTRLQNEEYLHNNKSLDLYITRFKTSDHNIEGDHKKKAQSANKCVGIHFRVFSIFCIFVIFFWKFKVFAFQFFCFYSIYVKYQINFYRPQLTPYEQLQQ